MCYTITVPRDARGPLDWRDAAACRDIDPELFFPEGTAGPAVEQAEQAKRVCESCPVRSPCLHFALLHGLAFGIWGGATGEERRSIKRLLPDQRGRARAEGP